MNNHRSWFALVTSCVTPALIVALGFAILFAGAAVAFAVADGGKPVAREAAPPREKVFVGLVTDDHCGARHDMRSDMNPAECTKMCVRNGSKYLLVEGNKRYTLLGSERQLEGLAGERANIAGMLEGSTIRVGSTSSLK